jgi:hypothetical protein
MTTPKKKLDYIKINLKDNDYLDCQEENSDCLICQEENNNTTIFYQHGCGDYYLHQECLDKWYKINGYTCIICRNNIIDNDYECNDYKEDGRRIYNITEITNNNLQGINNNCEHHIKPLLFRLCVIIMVLLLFISFYFIFSYR